MIETLETKTNTCVKFHDYTMSSFRGVSMQNIKLTDGMTDDGQKAITKAHLVNKGELKIYLV